ASERIGTITSDAVSIITDSTHYALIDPGSGKNLYDKQFEVPNGYELPVGSSVIPIRHAARVAVLMCGKSKVQPMYALQVWDPVNDRPLFPPVPITGEHMTLYSGPTRPLMQRAHAG